MPSRFSFRLKRNSTGISIPHPLSHHHSSVHIEVYFTLLVSYSMISPSTALTKVFDVVIIGGGLSGVMVAHELQKSVLPSSSPPPAAAAEALSWNLLEARPVLGGRLANDDKGNRIDLGGAWAWPDFQPNMKRLLRSLDRDISTFLQPDDPSSTRIDGGAVELVHALAKTLPPNNIRLNAPVTNCTLVDVADPMGENEACLAASSPQQEKQQDHAEREKVIRLDTAEGPVLAKKVVISVPPKLASLHIRFQPALSEAKQQAMNASHTWMAGVTKVSLVFDTKFWTTDISNMGLPRHLPGPAFQMYDASTKDGSVNAITMFALVPPESPAKTDNKVLGDQVASQVANVWNMYLGRGDLKEQIHNYKDVHVQHWPTQTYISEDPNPVQIHPHPHPVGALSTNEWDGHLLFAGSETDRQSPGVMEGAVGAALRVVQELKASTSSSSRK